MAKGRKINQKQFAKVIVAMYQKLFVADASLRSEPETDCVALAQVIEAAQQIYARDCPIARPATKRAKK